jgi:hypothetical protein
LFGSHQRIRRKSLYSFYQNDLAMNRSLTKLSAIPQNTRGMTRYAASDEHAIRFTVENRVAPYAVLERATFGGKTCSNAVAQLSRPAKDGSRPAMLQVHRHALPGGLSYLQPTAAACRLLGVSEKRAEPLGTAALSLHLGISYFCVMGAHRRSRLTRAELLPITGAAAPRENVHHVLAAPAERGHFAIYRIYQAVSELPQCVKHLTRLVSELMAAPRISELVRSREYGLAVLAPTPAHLADLRTAIADEGLDEHVDILSDLGPTAETLHDVLKGKGA